MFAKFKGAEFESDGREEIESAEFKRK